MNSKLVTNLTCYSLLSAAAAISFLLPERLVVEQTIAAPAAGDTIVVPAVVRDFRKSNASIATAPSAGNGHYAGNISQMLASNDRPAFMGGGYKVNAQWRDKNSNAIPPHLYMFSMGAPGTIPVALASPSPIHGIVDTYDSTLGPYGPGNMGPPPTYIVGAPMPEIAIPRSLSDLASSGNLTWVGPKTVSGDVHCNQLSITGAITISGHTRILCDSTFAINTGSSIAMAAGSTLKLYMKQGGSGWNQVTIGDPLNPNRVTAYNFGTAKFMIHNHADIYANFISPNASVELSNHGVLYGRYVGKTVEYDNHGDLHVNSGEPLDMCNVALDDSGGSKGATSSGGIPSAADFQKWYIDVPGANLSGRFDLELTKNSSGVYEYSNNEFHPS